MEGPEVARGRMVNRRAFIASITALLFVTRAVAEEEIVYFNTNSRKYHCATCKALRTCTHCVEMTLSKARLKGTPCKICGGSCR